MTTIVLNHLHSIPEGLLTSEAEQLHTFLPSPTLIELPGKQPEPLFISVLLHGNENTGLKALQALLNKYQGKDLPRTLAIFIGNIAAAKNNVRRLPDQPDYNRIWPGTELDDCAETDLARKVFEIMRMRNVFASIDIHNNTGMNPHYACINSLDEPFLKLAATFGRLVVFFLRPKGVQSAAFANLCPSVTLECGRPDQPLGTSHALDYLENCLHLTDFSQQPVKPQDIDLFHTVAQVRIADSTSFSFTDPAANLLLNKTIEQMNFTEIPAGTVFGKVNGTNQIPLLVQDEFGKNVTNYFFNINNNRLQIMRTSMPSMLTLNEEVIRQDCLCYLMERISIDRRHNKPASQEMG